MLPKLRYLVKLPCRRESTWHPLRSLIQLHKRWISNRQLERPSVASSSCCGSTAGLESTRSGALLQRTLIAALCRKTGLSSPPSPVPWAVWTPSLATAWVHSYGPDGPLTLAEPLSGSPMNVVSHTRRVPTSLPGIDKGTVLIDEVARLLPSTWPHCDTHQGHFSSLSRKLQEYTVHPEGATTRWILIPLNGCPVTTNGAIQHMPGPIWSLVTPRVALGNSDPSTQHQQLRALHSQLKQCNKTSADYVNEIPPTQLYSAVWPVQRPPSIPPNPLLLGNRFPSARPPPGRS